MCAVLQFAQPRRVGRRHVHHHEVRHAAQQPERRQVIVGRTLQRRHLRLADVHANGDAGPGTTAGIGDAPGGDRGSVVVEPHAVDDGLVVGQPEQAGLRVTGLGTRGDGADLGESKTQPAPGPHGPAVLVVSGRQAHGALEWQAHQVLPHRGIAPRGPRRCSREAGAAHLQRAQRGLVRALGIHAEGRATQQPRGVDGQARASRSHSEASAVSFSVMPPSSCVANRSVTAFHRMSISG